MNLRNFITFTSLLFFSLSSYALSSMKNCVLLPITDSVQGGISFKVFEEVETYLKESSWCYYQSNSDILSILGNYEQNLDNYLENEKVLQLIASKLNVGSLIRIKLSSQIKGMDVQMEVVGENGADRYFKEKLRLEDDSISLIGQTIKNWLELYEKTIPYDGLVLGVLGNQLTIDVGRASKVRIGQTFIVKRPSIKRVHPLLKEIVEWETITLGQGKIFNVSEFQASGAIKLLHSEKKIQKGDWIRVEEAKYKPIDENLSYSEIKGNEFGKLGYGKISLLYGKGTASSVLNNTNRSIGGAVFGFDANLVAWATRSFWAGMDLGRQFGSYKKQTQNSTINSNSFSGSQVRVYAGYKYLPLGFFYGPQINGYIGYAKYTYGLDTVSGEGFSTESFYGILMGFNGNIPVHKDFRLYGKFDFLPKPGFGEETVIYGEKESASTYEMEIGCSYAYNPITNLEGGFKMSSSRAKFPTSEIHHKNSGVKFGATFSF